MQSPPKYRYRLTFSKGHPVKYVAHLDVVLAWTRAFRRAEIPLAYSGGFNPRAKIHVAASLPVGTMGAAELMDIFLTEPMAPDEILHRVRATLPNGFKLHAVKKVAAKAPGLQASLRQADYVIVVETNLAESDLTTRISTLLAQDSIMQTRIRRNKEELFNLRPLLHTLELVAKNKAEATLAMRLSAGQQGNLRPDAVLHALGIRNTWYQAERTKLIFDI